MKNLILKSILIFGIMTFLNAGLVGESVKLIGLPPSSHTLHGFAIFIGCLIICVVSFITILIFQKSYNAVWKVALLFEILYLLMLLWSKINPFTYFTQPTDDHLLDMMLYLNSIIIFLVICLFDVIYSKIISSKIKK
ncbi:hypothetical protein ACM46_20690 [Chryseobacterium angstadtii]|uniref:Uncharacterized protein n=1 Tax=Chryseobacterium angstadtii TaxID=558151 RepID=A0A0J7KQI3_9FLAO|nr:hypothetical protein [Chryseobacterium angstadtii]KMQ59505.1 hypothetical protein ACM46_20690 [Chryseobacterium angstadtii]